MNAILIFLKGAIVDEDDLELMLDSYPSLFALRPFLALAEAMPWFRTIGEPNHHRLELLVGDYAASLGFPDVFPAVITDWVEAAEAIETLDLNSPAWEAEEQLRAGLAQALVERLGEEIPVLLTEHISNHMAPVLEAAALEAAEYLRIDDEAFLRAAFGSAIQACHMAAFVAMTDGGDDHPFSKRFALYEIGRWPLGLMGGSFLVF